MNTLDELFAEISKEIENEIKLIDTKKILQKYQGNDWIKYAKLSKENYKRVLISKNEFIEIILIGWNVNQKSAIHDHPKNGCLVKILDGQLNETIFINNLEKIKENVLLEGNISYQIGNKILHKIENITSNPVFSLHVYSPPNYISNSY